MTAEAAEAAAPAKTTRRKPPTPEQKARALARNRSAAADGPHLDADPSLSRLFPRHAERLAYYTIAAKHGKPLFPEPANQKDAAP